ncbi:hypothetical protein D3C74_348960 [compost metagenome]
MFNHRPDETLKLIKRHVLGIGLVRAVWLDLDVLSIGQHVHGLHERIDAHGVQELARSQRQDGEGTGQHEEVVQHPVMHLTGLEVIRHTEVEVQVLSDLVDQREVRDQHDVIKSVPVQDLFHLLQVLRWQQEDFTAVDVDVPYVIVLKDLQQPFFKDAQVHACPITQLLRREVAELTAQVAVIRRVYAEVDFWLRHL